MFRNGEYYSDPTTGQALSTIAAEERDEVMARIKAAMKVIRPAAELAGLEISERIVFRDKATGREYR